MAHYEKYHMSDVNGLLAHDNRTMKTERENIDDSKSHLNYNLHKHENGEYNFFKNRVEYAKKQRATVRDNSVVMCSLIVTLPEDFPDSEELEKVFFESVYEFAKQKHGEENIISAWVHYDECKKNETRPNKPHLHFKFTPILQTKKKYKNGEEKERLAFNANKIINPIYLQNFHNELSDYIEQEMGFKVSILNGATKNGNQTIEQLKQKSKLDKEITEQKAVLEKLKTECIKYPDELEKERKRIIDKLWKEYQAKSKAYWSNYKTTKQDINNSIYELKRGIWGSERQLYKDLDFINNLSNGLLFALFSLISAVITLTCKEIMQHELNTLKNDLERLNEQRRKVSNYQNNTKEKLKKEDIIEIERALEKWENSLTLANDKIFDVINDKEKKQEELELSL